MPDLGDCRFLDAPRVGMLVALLRGLYTCVQSPTRPVS